MKAMFLVAAMALGGLAVPVASAQAPASAEYLNAAKTVPSNLPFSEAVRVGDTLYLSGQVGIKPGTLQLVPGGIKGQARQAMENIRAVLRAQGADMGNLVKCTAMLADMAQWNDFNSVYMTFFQPGHYPARSAFGTTGLAIGALVEVECIAALPPRGR